MRPILLAILFFICGTCPGNAASMDTLLFQGDINKYVNLVVVGDGYTASQQTKFRSDADSLIRYLFRQSPWDAYESYFNVFAIHTVSVDSGISHAGTASDCAGSGVPVVTKNTFLGVAFDQGGVHRMPGVMNVTNFSNLLSGTFPLYDHVLVLSNSPHYGGAGGSIAVSTVNSQSSEVVAHELGHSFGKVLDEYFPGDGFMREAANMTQTSNVAQVRWKAWLGTPGVSVVSHCCGGSAATWFKPGNGCKMQSNGPPYCPVCKEAIIEAIHAKANPIVAYSPDTLSTITSAFQVSLRVLKLMRPRPNTLKLSWSIDGKPLSQYDNQDSIQLRTYSISKGTHRISVTATDTSPMVRITNHATIHQYSVSWKVVGYSTGIARVAGVQELQIEASPNPAHGMLNLHLELSRPEEISVGIRDMAGRTVIRPVRYRKAGTSIHEALDITSLAPGVYLLSVDSESSGQTLRFVKS